MLKLKEQLSQTKKITKHVYRCSYKQKLPPEVFFKKAVLKNFATFIEKQLCWSLFLIKLQTFRPATLLKSDSNTGVFLRILWNYNTYFEEHLRTATSAYKSSCELALKFASCFFINYRTSYLLTPFYLGGGGGSYKRK